MSLDVAASWELTRQLSPRSHVRVAAVDAYGNITNEYPPPTAATAGGVPASTWAMPLTDPDWLYRFICFDLDVSHGRAHVDAGRLTLWLYDLGIPHLVAESGPSGGRHVWIGLQEGVSAELVHQLGALAQRLLPTLDLSQWNNASTGSIRPPGAPHRDGGHSHIIEGHIGVLTDPTVTRGDVVQLRDLLLELAGPLPEPLHAAATRKVELDDAGQPVIVTPARVTFRPTRADGDASAILASAIARCFHAGMTFEQVLAIAPENSAFVHAFTERTSAGRRTPRSAQSTQKILERQWARVTRWVHATPTAFTATDPDFEARAAATVALVDALQGRANASPGRWSRHGAGPHQSAGTGRYTDRLVLDALCFLALQAVSGLVEASARTLSQITGAGRETCRTALQRLQEDGWVDLDTPAEGVRAAKWRLRDLSTARIDLDRSQVVPPPDLLSAAALRKLHLENLGERLQLTRHDVFAAPHSLGRTTGRVYAALRGLELPDLTEISRSTSLSAPTVRRSLRALTRYQLADTTEGFWQRAPDIRDRVAGVLGVAGYLEDRERRYSAEREAWAWWQAELEHRRAPRGRRRRRRHSTQLGLLTLAGSPPEFPIHPRRRDGRADFAAALELVREGLLQGESSLERMVA